MASVSRHKTLLLLSILGVFVVLEHNVIVEGRPGKCNIYEGSWVHDQTYPLYNNENCPFIYTAFNCRPNGRPDQDFEKFRWQPSACDLPRFDGLKFLLKMRGKSIMFVGDSLSLNQWQSLTCMLHAAAPHLNFTSERTGLISTFTFPAFDLKIMIYRKTFLVDIVRTSHGAALKLDSMHGGEEWKYVDVLVFDSWHWWIHTGRKQPWKYIQIGNTTFKDMNRLEAYSIALNTWANWVDALLRDSTKTKIFFQGVSPDHMNGREWGENGVVDCKEEKYPIRGSKYPGGKIKAEEEVERVIRRSLLLNPKARNQVKLLNVTNLSQLRKDGHPSIYGLRDHRGMDCTHWCLPGVPDTWNQLLYAELLH